jgi:hypothetical protein
MDDDLSLEAHINDLETLVSGMADLLSLTFARSLALMNLLDRKKLLDHTEVAALMKQMEEDSDFAVEFGSEYRAFRRWRREREGRAIPPDDSPASA